MAVSLFRGMKQQLYETGYGTRNETRNETGHEIGYETGYETRNEILGYATRESTRVVNHDVCMKPGMKPYSRLCGFIPPKKCHRQCTCTCL